MAGCLPEARRPGIDENQVLAVSGGRGQQCEFICDQDFISALCAITCRFATVHLICDQALSLAEPRKAGFDDFRELRDSKRSGAETPLKSSLLEISLRRAHKSSLQLFILTQCQKMCKPFFMQAKIVQGKKVSHPDFRAVSKGKNRTRSLTSMLKKR